MAPAYLIHRWNGIDDEIRTKVEAKLRDHYASVGLDVTIESAQRIEGEGIRIDGITITPSTMDESSGKSIAEIKSVMLHCDASVKTLLLDNVQIRHVTVTDPKLHAWRESDGTWNVEKLLKRPKFGDHQTTPPTVTVEDGLIEIINFKGRAAQPYVVRNINLRIDRRLPGKSDADQERSNTDSQTAATDKTPGYQFRGDMTGEFVRQIHFRGDYTPTSGKANVSGQIRGAELTSELFAALPPDIAQRLVAISKLRGQVDADFLVSHDPSKKESWQYKITSKLSQGRMVDPRLPYPLAGLSATVLIDNRGIDLRNMTGSLGLAEFELTCQHAGFSEDGTLRLEAKAKSVLLDPSWQSLLPPSMQTVWNHYQPAGQIDVEDLSLTFDGKTWKPEGKIRCRDVSFTYYKFPYRLEKADGTIELRDNRMTFDLTAYTRDRPVRITGVQKNPGPNATGWIQIQADDIPLDDKFHNSLTKEVSRVVTPLGARGNIDFYSRFSRDDPSEKMREDVIIGLRNCAIRYERFPFLFENVTGTLEMHDRHWTYRDIKSGNVSLTGGWTPDAQGGHLDLHITAENVPMDDKLREALPAMAQRTWRELRPRGTVDRLEVNVHYLRGEPQADVVIRARKWPAHEKRSADNISIFPAYFPYRFADVSGGITFRDGKLDLHDVRASHGNTRFRTSGFCRHFEDGSSHVRFADLHVDRLPTDSDLMAALPEKARQALEKLNLSGPVNLRGLVDFRRPANTRSRDQLRTSWDVNVDLEQAAIDCGVKLSNINGSLRLVGDHNAERGFYSRGRLDLDAVTYKGFQLTEVRGPLELTDKEIRLGVYAKRLDRRRPPTPLRAKLYDGVVVSDALVTLGEQPRFSLQAQLTGGDLRKFALENMPGRHQLSGRMMAMIQLEGTGKSTGSLTGKGKIRLRDARIYELPFMVALLKFVSFKSPDKTAFRQTDVDFDIKGQNVYLHRLNFSGDAISLVGKGWVNFDRQIKMNFYSVIGRNRVTIPIVGPLLNEASRNIMEIKVDGSLDDPKMRQEPFPGLKQFLKQLDKMQAEITKPLGTARRADRSPAVRRKSNSIPTGRIR